MDIPQQICDLITLVYDKETDKIFIIPTANEVVSRVMRKNICRLRPSKVSRQ